MNCGDLNFCDIFGSLKVNDFDLDKISRNVNRIKFCRKNFKKSLDESNKFRQDIERKISNQSVFKWADGELLRKEAELVKKEETILDDYSLRKIK